MVLFNRRKYMGVRRSPQGAPLNLADAVITVAASVQYTGSPRTPSVTVVYEGTTLVANTDYFVAYNDNTNIGAATVVVTGTGSFTGTVVKTFYIVEASEAPWAFDLTSADYVGTKSVSNSGQYILGFVENYNQAGGAIPVHKWVSNSWLVGYLFPKDQDGEFHVSNIDASSSVFVDGTGAGGDYLHPFYFDKTRSFWYSNGVSYVLKANDGTESPDFSDVLSNSFSGSYTPFVVNGGRKLMVPQGGIKVCSFAFGTRYAMSSIDISSKIETDVGAIVGQANPNNQVKSCVFCGGGSQALVSVTDGRIYHLSCPTPYELYGAEKISQMSFTQQVSYPRIFGVVNDGKTLILSGNYTLYEYALA